MRKLLFVLAATLSLAATAPAFAQGYPGNLPKTNAATSQAYSMEHGQPSGG